MHWVRQIGWRKGQAHNGSSSRNSFSLCCTTNNICLSLFEVLFEVLFEKIFNRGVWIDE